MKKTIMAGLVSLIGMIGATASMAYDADVVMVNLQSHDVVSAVELHPDALLLNEVMPDAAMLSVAVPDPVLDTSKLTVMSDVVPDPMVEANNQLSCVHPCGGSTVRYNLLI